MKAAKRRYNQKHSTKIRTKEYYYENREKFMEYRSKRANKIHDIDKNEWEACKDYFDNSCAYCGLTEEKAKEMQGQYLHKEHVDHEGLNDLSNCVPVCKSCNSSKRDYHVDEWYNENNANFTKERLELIKHWLDTDHLKYKTKENSVKQHKVKI
jgi:HNH endonuclease